MIAAIVAGAPDGSPVEVFARLPGPAGRGLRRSRPITRRRRLLELGCGAGRITRALLAARSPRSWPSTQSAAMLGRVDHRAERVLADAATLALDRTLRRGACCASYLVNHPTRGADFLATAAAPPGAGRRAWSSSATTRAWVATPTPDGPRRSAR